MLEVARRMKEIRELLDSFGLVLAGYDPGVTAHIRSEPAARGQGWGGEPINFDCHEWRWLEPLLVELRERRLYQEG